MDRLPPLRLLTIFDAVCRLGSMQLAAAELNVTRPAVSQAIRALEEHVGALLFDRSVKPSAVTEAGARLAEGTRSGLALITDAIDEIRLAGGQAERQVTVCCTLGMASHWLMPRLAAFHAGHPDIMVNVQAPPSGLPVFSAGVDIALRYGPRPWKDGPTVRLFAERVCPVGRPDVIRALAGDPGGLRDATLIHVQVPRSFGWAGWTDYFSAVGLPRARGPKQILDNYIQAVQATLDGRGVMLGWRSITGALVAEGRLMALPGGSRDLGTSYWATCAPDSQQKPAVTAFMDWLQAAARQASVVPPAMFS